MARAIVPRYMLSRTLLATAARLRHDALSEIFRRRRLIILA